METSDPSDHLSDGISEDPRQGVASCNYGDINYWEDRYEVIPDPYDWLVTYKDISNVIEGMVPKDARILIPGCGNACRVHFKCMKLVN